jgi:hypothetical protein
MSHRYGHVDNFGDGTLSMNRRKYISTLAAGATFGAVAAGLAACGSPSSSGNVQESESETKAMAPAASGCVTLKQWGHLSIFPPGILTLEEAKASMPTTGSRMIKVPFFNSNGIALSEGMVVGFHLVRIGCPTTLFVVAFNLADHDHHNIPEDEREWYIRRNNNMDTLLRSIGYEESDWVKEDPNPCDKPADDWSK